MKTDELKNVDFEKISKEELKGTIQAIENLNEEERKELFYHYIDNVVGDYEVIENTNKINNLKEVFKTFDSTLEVILEESEPID